MEVIDNLCLWRAEALPLPVPLMDSLIKPLSVND